jgi:hypothetical protein
MIGSAVGGYVDPDVIKGQQLNDAQQLTVTEGAPRPIIKGTAVVSGNVIHAGPLVPYTTSERTGKGGPIQETNGQTITFALRGGEGPIGNVSRIWENDKLCYDVRDPAAWPNDADAIRAMAGDSAKYATGITIYKGTETQLPDPALEALPEEYDGGVGNVCAHRGTWYIVYTDKDVTESGGAIPQIRIEVSCCGDATTTVADVPWVHGDTGNAQSIFAIAVKGLTCFTAGWNDNFRRSRDGGRNWAAVDYLSTLGWLSTTPIEAVWNVPSQNTDGDWYIAKSDEVAVSYNGGGLFNFFCTPDHVIVGRIGPGGGVHKMPDGRYLAGAAETVNTIVFDPTVIGGTDIDLGADYGRATAIADVGGGIIVGTDTGNIVQEDGTLVHTVASNEIVQFAQDAHGVIIAVWGSGGYSRSTNSGGTWTDYPTGSFAGCVYARNRFYFVAAESIAASDDGLTLTTVDTSFAGNGSTSLIATDGYSVLATEIVGKTASLPSAFLLPDTAFGLHLDDLGNVVADTTTAVDRCVAQLDEIVLDICGRVGLTAAQVDVTQLAGIEVRGFVIGQQMAAADALRSLQQYYFFDLPEWGDYTDTGTKLRAIRRGGASLFTITDDDLVESDDDEDTRAQAVEFPRKINLVTSDVDSDYNPTKQTFERRTDNVKAVGETSFTLPVVTIRTEAAKAVDIMGKVAWEEALGRTTFILPEEFSALTPSDCLTKDSKRWRAEKCEYGDGTVNVEAVRDRASAYTSVATPGDAPAPSVPPATLRGPTMFAALNLPALRSSEITPGMQIGVCGRLDGWIGCDLYLSVDGGISEQLVATYLSETTMGVLAADCDSGATDLITASVYHGHELDSVTDAQIAALANAWAITTNGTSEIGQFKTATETATAGTYDLTDLVRDELGTIAAAHSVGNSFVMLDGMNFLPIDARHAGKTLIFRPVSRGTAIANNPTYSVIYAPQFTSAAPVSFLLDESGGFLSDEAGGYLSE